MRVSGRFLICSRCGGALTAVLTAYNPAPGAPVPFADFQRPDDRLECAACGARYTTLIAYTDLPGYAWGVVAPLEETADAT